MDLLNRLRPQTHRDHQVPRVAPQVALVAIRGAVAVAADPQEAQEAIRGAVAVAVVLQVAREAALPHPMINHQVAQEATRVAGVAVMTMVTTTAALVPPPLATRLTTLKVDFQVTTLTSILSHWNLFQLTPMNSNIGQILPFVKWLPPPQTQSLA